MPHKYNDMKIEENLEIKKNNNNNNNKTVVDPDEVNLVYISDNKRKKIPSATMLLSSSPDHYGFLTKVRTRSICNNMIPCCWNMKKTTIYNKRFFILCGRYLFRYKDENGMKPVGAPIPLNIAFFKKCPIVSSSSSSSLDDNDNDNDNDNVEFQYQPNSFMISTMRKEIHVIADSEEEMNKWLYILIKAKERAMKELLGHAIPKGSHTLPNIAGEFLYQQKARKNIDEINLTMDTEMSPYDSTV